jgi:hypothetical protein
MHVALELRHHILATPTRISDLSAFLVSVNNEFWHLANEKIPEAFCAMTTGTKRAKVDI